MLLAPFSREHLADRFGEWPEWRKVMGLGPHRGQDWNGLPAGTPIPAGGTGVVVWRTNLADPETTELGHRIVIGYELGDDTVFIGYCHLHRNPTLAVGARVRSGDTVGLLGNSGTASTGAHLHQTASWQSGNPGTVIVFDPLEVQTFSSSPAGGGGTPIEEDDMFTDDDRDRMVRIEDALFKKTQVEGTTTGGNPMPGGLLRMASIQYDATFQEEGKGGATRDGLFPFMAKVRKKLGI